VSDDPTIRRIRDEISQLDRDILEAVNARLELVARLKLYKEKNGFPFLDPDRERQLLAELEEANPGPLTNEGLRELVTTILGLTKRELERDGE
jgi:chorismate mutase/prephenate dehydratase